jgi:hypothetical protein
VIIVKIERWPDGVDPNDPAAARSRIEIAKAVIRNDHTGSPDHGNYDVQLYDPPAYNPWAGVNVDLRVENFPRRTLGAWHLIARALRQFEEQRPADENSD